MQDTFFSNSQSKKIFVKSFLTTEDPTLEKKQEEAEIGWGQPGLAGGKEREVSLPRLTLTSSISPEEGVTVRTA